MLSTQKQAKKPKGNLYLSVGLLALYGFFQFQKECKLKNNFVVIP